MNKTKIEWCDYTWNPVTGCHHNCSYCYARRMAERFQPKETRNSMKVGIKLAVVGNKTPFLYGFTPTLYSLRLDEPSKVKNPSRIFTVSMGDLFGEWVPKNWVKYVLNTVKQCQQHTFIFLTKNPSGMYGYDFPKNCWCGTTMTIQSEIYRKCELIVNAPVRFLSIEPLLGPIEADFSDVQWIIVGAQTGPGAVKPKPEWVQAIINQARHQKIPVFLKDNLHWSEKIQEFPEVR